MKAVIFDMDGILFDTERMGSRVWGQIAEQDALEDIENTLLACIGRSRTDAKCIFTGKYGEHFDYEGFREKADVIFKEIIAKEGIPIKEGVHELLAFLKEAGYRIGLASSTHRVSILSHLEETGIGDYFEVIVAGDMVKHSKPNPEIYTKACEELGVAPSECYCIEDSPNGVRAAYAAGLKVIMVPDLIQPTEEISTMLYKNFDSLLQVKRYLEKTKNQ